MTLFDRFRERRAEGYPVALATVVAGQDGVGSKLLVLGDGKTEGKLQPPELAGQVAETALQFLLEERSDTHSFVAGGAEYDVFLDVYPASKQLIIVGASHAAGPLSTFAKALGFRVVICDARAAFALPERYPDADQVLKGWPQDVLPSLRLDESTYLVLLSHDAKFDEPTLEIALPSGVRYIGAIGSRRTQQARFERLRAAGHSEEQLARVHGPVGLDIGGDTPEETAIAILGEIIAVRHGRKGGMMRDRTP